ncbi:hypothetical protein MASR2M39_15260 [Ignavibacteriales bacterium]
MPGKAIIILLTGIIALSAITIRNISQRDNELTAHVVNVYSDVQIKNIAETGVQMALRKIQVDTAWRTGFPLMNLLGGKVSVRAKDTTFLSQNLIKIEAFAFTGYGSSNQQSYTVMCYLARSASGGTRTLPPALKGAVTANSAVSTLGNLQVDGRDHTIAGAVVAGQGSFGIWTTSSLSQSGSSDIGGTVAGTDWGPSKPAKAGTVATFQVYPGGYPSTPDSVMGGPANGYPEGTLKATAIAGTGGSQYVTNPALLTYPLKGVTYVELPSGSIWNSANITGSGILIIHNSSSDAAIKNLNSGPFKGVMIADDIIHVHTDIIGAVVGLSKAPSSGNCLGNGSGAILYSKAAINDGLNVVPFAGSGGLTSSSANVVYWWEQ